MRASIFVVVWGFGVFFVCLSVFSLSFGLQTLDFNFKDTRVPIHPGRGDEWEHGTLVSPELPPHF